MIGHQRDKLTGEIFRQLEVRNLQFHLEYLDFAETDESDLIDEIAWRIVLDDKMYNGSITMNVDHWFEEWMIQVPEFFNKRYTQFHQLPVSVQQELRLLRKDLTEEILERYDNAEYWKVGFLSDSERDIKMNEEDVVDFLDQIQYTGE